MKISGIRVSPGVAAGPVYLYVPEAPEVAQVSIEQTQVEETLGRYQKAQDQAMAELKDLKARFDAAGDDKAKIFAAHMEILDDPAMASDIQALISEGLRDAAWAVHDVFEQYAELLGTVDDPLLRERAADIRDVGSRVLRILSGRQGASLSALPGPVVVVANDLTPSDTATMDREKVLAILCETGGPTSHTAILAKSYGIPAILGAGGILSAVSPGATVIADAMTGEINTAPSEEELAAAEEKREAFLRRKADEKAYLAADARLESGEKVQVCLNIGSDRAEELAMAENVDGVGLFRTEFLFLGKAETPSEEEQFRAYKRVLETFGDKPVILRTLDIGGDKKVPCLDLPHEDNPFLGNRALRLCFSRPELFQTQLRAMLRASVYGKLWIMLPMVASMDDIRRAKEVISGVRERLSEEGVPVSPDIKIGIMIEIPAIALMADQAAEEVDFASFGTNDLCQYLTAVDRLSPTVSGYYQSYHPAMFRLMALAAGEFVKRGKSISVCGELGGDPLAQAVLLGLGIRKLSMSAGAVAQAKKEICHLSEQRVKELAQKVQTMSTADEVKQYLTTQLADVL